MAMFDTMIFTDDFMHHSLDEFPLVRLGGEYWRLGNDEWLLVSGQFKFVWAMLSRNHGLSDPGPAASAELPAVEETLDQKVKRRREIVRQFLRSLPNFDAAQSVLEAAQIACGRYNTPEQALRTPTALHRGVVAQVDDRAGGTRGVMQTPYRFSNFESGVKGGASFRGEDNASVLSDWLGRSDADALTSSGALQQNIPTT
jgi:crotonobetainyl-CoA:carnitine CoA-transferase CaiB-like acyl-CoA transferase